MFSHNDVSEVLPNVKVETPEYIVWSGFTEDRRGGVRYIVSKHTCGMSMTHFSMPPINVPSGIYYLEGPRTRAVWSVQCGKFDRSLSRTSRAVS